MINVVRRQQAPDALNSPEIQTYIRAAILHLTDPVNNPKPAKPVTYRTSDLLEAFDHDFYSKCYLTEMKFINSWIMDIEHFLSQNERPDLIYEWTNLFPAEHYSNMIKPRTTPPGGLLDPSNPADNVETEILYSLSAYGYEPQFDPFDLTNVKASNTCILLNRIHNGHDELTKKGTSDLRHGIHKKYIEVLRKIIDWRRFEEGTAEKNQAKRELKDLLSRKSSFTMLIRSMPAVQQLPHDFFD
jgi:hypothetical protein